MDKIKNSPDYQTLKELIREAVNSITSEQLLSLQVCLIAIMKLIQKDPTLIPLIQFPVPGDNDIYTADYVLSVSAGSIDYENY